MDEVQTNPPPTAASSQILQAVNRQGVVVAPGSTVFDRSGHSYTFMWASVAAKKGMKGKIVVSDGFDPTTLQQRRDERYAEAFGITVREVPAPCQPSPGNPFRSDDAWHIFIPNAPRFTVQMTDDEIFAFSEYLEEVIGERDFDVRHSSWAEAELCQRRSSTAAWPSHRMGTASRCTSVVASIRCGWLASSG